MGTSLAVQRLRLCASTAGGAGSIPGWGTKIPHAVRRGQKVKKQNKSSDEKENTHRLVKMYRMLIFCFREVTS